jgi:hypothetical protein
MSYREVMELPIRAFWLMSANINRLFAEHDMRLLSVTAAVNSTEGMQEKIDMLSTEIGKVTRFDEVFDSSAMESLMNSL